MKDWKKGNANVDEYNDAMGFCESDDTEEFGETLKEIGTPSLPATIWLTLIFSGPVGRLFINISRGMLEGIAVISVLAIISTVIITLCWSRYLRARKYQAKRVKEIGKGQRALFPLMFAVIVATLALLVFVSMGVAKLLAPENMLFYEHNQMLTYVMMIFVMLLVLVMSIGLLRRFFSHSIEKLDFSWLNIFYKRPLMSMLVWLLVMYVCLTNVTFVTEGTIIRHTPLCPQGKVYSYEDVEKVKAGFGTKTLSIAPYNRKGEFSYTIYVDGKKIIFVTPSVNEEIERYMEHTYLELEEFDEKLMQLGIRKISSDECYQYCDLDKEYVERYLRIIKRKN